ncbi:MAG: DMT family transporter [Litoreibacter sp.]|nr:DMT family transporter [Litoreibacter sp.]
MARLTQNPLLAAAFCAALGMALLGLIDNFVRVLAQDIGLWQFHLTRTIIAFVLIGPLVWFFGWKIRPQRAWAVSLRSFFVATAMILYFGSVAVLPIAEVAAGLFTSPLFVLVILTLGFGQKIGPRRIFAALFGFTGVLLILRPDAAGLSLGSLIPVLAGFFYACGAVATKRLCEGEGTVALLVGFFLFLGLWGLGGSLYFLLTGQATDPAIDGFFGTGWQPFTARALFWTFAQAVVSLVGVGLIIRGYQLADASFVAVFEYSFLISAGLWAYLLWGDVPDRLALVGIAMIVVAGIVIILRSEEPGLTARRPA